MNITISFELPEELYQYKRCIHAGKAWDAIEEMDRRMRNFRKYSDQTGADALALAEEIGNLLDDVRIDMDC
jgi:hypothetical protein